MAVVGLIPARGGSKGIPKKNIAPCAGRPLIAYTCDAARGAKRLDRTLLSTDSEEIAEVVRPLGIEVPFLRPPALARDDTPALPVMVHALDWLESHGERVEAIVLLQPTSPLRTAAHVDAAVDLFSTAGADTVVSVVPVPHRYHPDSVMRMRDGRLAPYREDRETVTRRQELEPLFARNGPAVLVVSAATLRAGRLYGPHALGYAMSHTDSIDVDDAEDLALAGQLLAARRGLG